MIDHSGKLDRDIEKRMAYTRDLQVLDYERSATGTENCASADYPTNAFSISISFPLRAVSWVAEKAGEV